VQSRSFVGATLQQVTLILEEILDYPYQRPAALLEHNQAHVTPVFNLAVRMSTKISQCAQFQAFDTLVFLATDCLTSPWNFLGG